MLSKSVAPLLLRKCSRAGLTVSCQVVPVSVIVVSTPSATSRPDRATFWCRACLEDLDLSAAGHLLGEAGAVLSLTARGA